MVQKKVGGGSKPQLPKAPVSKVKKAKRPTPKRRTY